MLIIIMMCYIIITSGDLWVQRVPPPVSLLRLNCSFYCQQSTINIWGSIMSLYADNCEADDPSDYEQ